MLGRTRTAGHYARGFAAAVVTVAALVLAANAVPARATHPDPGPRTTAPAEAAVR